MLFEFIFIGKTKERFLAEGIDYYRQRLDHYMASRITIVHASKEKTIERIMADEARRILQNVSSKDYFILLDENGKHFLSVEFAVEVQRIMNQSFSKIIFVTGSAYGSDETLEKRANLIISFSRFTLTHEMIRLVLLEQAYRAMTILRSGKYHH